MLVLLVFAITLFISSFLLFLVQPLFAKMVLPLLGGTPAVWNTCMVFFQAALLAGYGYAHAIPARLGVRRQAALHLAVVLLPLLVLPLGMKQRTAPPADANPIPWLLGLLTISVGLPFFVIAASGPLLQRWLAASSHPAAKDPYFLFSASNLGSMLGLLCYPFLLEPSLSLASQRWLWTLGYGLLVVLLFTCVILVWRYGPGPSLLPEQARTTDYGLRTNQRLRWVALAFVPSSLLLSVTSYLTTDIAAIPLLWVVPLAVYLLTFILVFSRRTMLSHRLMVRVFPAVVLVLTFVLLSQATEPAWLLLPLNVLAFFVIGMVCHGELARERPPAAHLTEFYLWLSVGGVLGGLFNALIAPLIFPSLVEYPLGLILACLLWPQQTEVSASLVSRWLPDAGLGIVPGVLMICTMLVLRHEGLESSIYGLAVILGLPTVICYTFVGSPLRFGLGVGSLLAAGSLYQGVYGKPIYRERSFFGVHQVVLDPVEHYYKLIHGNTIHGLQRPDPDHHPEPLLYYHRTGPIGQVFQAFSGEAAKPLVGLVGLGAGSLAAYGEPGQEFTYYEIDPAVVHIARDSGYFTFLRDCRADLHIVLGDARLTLERAPQHYFGILVIDAFSSDSIPLHLLTREALRLYKEKLAEGGILAFNISNRYLDLEPVLGDLARDGSLLCWTQRDLDITEEEKKAGKAASQWVLMARRQADLGRLGQDRRWQEVRDRRGARLWTDDFSNIFSVFKWE